jgi:hypothetical protein
MNYEASKQMGKDIVNFFKVDLKMLYKKLWYSRFTCRLGLNFSKPFSLVEIFCRLDNSPIALDVLLHQEELLRFYSLLDHPKAHGKDYVDNDENDQITYD